MPKVFELDEATAAQWLGDAAADTAGAKWGEPPAPAVELPDDYRPGDYEAADTTTDLVIAARDAGLITGPGSVDFDYDRGDPGYRWVVCLDGPGDLRLTTLHTKLSWLGDSTALPGEHAALTVLCDAVTAANQLLAGLDAYSAARKTGA